MKLLAEALRYGDYGNGEIRLAAAQVLGQIGDGRALELLVAALNNPDEEDLVRASAAEALGQIGDADTVAPLVATLSGRRTTDSLAHRSRKVRAPSCG